MYNILNGEIKDVFLTYVTEPGATAVSRYILPYLPTLKIIRQFRLFFLHWGTTLRLSSS